MIWEIHNYLIQLFINYANALCEFSYKLFFTINFIKLNKNGKCQYILM